MKRLTMLLFAGAMLWGHHSTSAEFDTAKRVSTTGKLTKIDWVNPHIFIYLEVASEEWKFETNPPAWFKRVSVNRADFAKYIGQSVTVEGNPAKDGSHYGYLLKITFAD